MFVSLDRTRKTNFARMILPDIGTQCQSFCKSDHGSAGYSEMARMLGLNDVADKYAAIAKKNGGEMGRNGE